MAEPQHQPEPLWWPTEPEQTEMARFVRSVGLADTAELQRWSVNEPAAFWAALGSYLGIEPLVAPAATDLMMDAAFDGPDLNVAQFILAGSGSADVDDLWIQRDERGRRRVVSFGEGRSLVAAVRAALAAEGVTSGDHVAAWLPNSVETQATMLGAAALGAVFCSTSPDFGVDGVVDRFAQLDPVVLVVPDGYTYGGKVVELRAVAEQIAQRLPSVQRVIEVPFLRNAEGTEDGTADRTAEGTDDGRWIGWEQWISPHLGAPEHYEQLPFNQPWLVLFSSGTTGVPKCIVHRAGGVLIQHLKEHQLHCDLRVGDRAMYFTTAGWMMWNWLSTVPASGAAIVLYDGSPFHPHPAALLDIAQEEGLTLLGLGAKLIDALRKEGLRPIDTHDLGELRTVLSTGSPLSNESFGWIYDSLSSTVHLASISGGTDLCGCFVAGDPTRPVVAGEIQMAALGMAVEIWDEAGRPVPNGERGELVCTRPFPSQPLGFFGDTDRSRLRGAYFERFEPDGSVWAHGDFASRTSRGGYVIHGRSDTTLNPGGVRIGTAEIYRQVEQLDEIVEALVFGQVWDNDTRIVLLVRTAPGVALDETLTARIRSRIREGCTPRHVPARIVAVDDLPRTRSGKLAELAVADAVNGRSVRNTTALANPETLDRIAALPQLRA